jgi:hypothetical protein
VCELHGEKPSTFGQMMCADARMDNADSLHEGRSRVRLVEQHAAGYMQRMKSSHEEKTWTNQHEAGREIHAKMHAADPMVGTRIIML